MSLPVCFLWAWFVLNYLIIGVHTQSLSFSWAGNLTQIMVKLSKCAYQRQVTILSVNRHRQPMCVGFPRLAYWIAGYSLPGPSTFRRSHHRLCRLSRTPDHLDLSLAHSISRHYCQTWSLQTCFQYLNVHQPTPGRTSHLTSRLPLVK